MTRYDRQTILQRLAQQAQQELAAARVVVGWRVVCRAGAAGCLRGAGVGILTLIDGDHVTLSNLPTDTVQPRPDIAPSKVTVAARAMTATQQQL